jgi:hypothetical protein
MLKDFEDFTDADFMLERLLDTGRFVVPEIVTANQAVLLEANTDYHRAEMIAKCEYHLRMEMVDSFANAEAVLARLDFKSLDRGLLRLVTRLPGGHWVVHARSLKELDAIARDDWDYQTPMHDYCTMLNKPKKS